MNLLHGVGINDRKYPSVVKGKARKEYQLWVNMIGRCYNQKFKSKYPAYRDCTVSDNFKNYSYFYEWCQNQIGFGVDGFQLDKDFLSNSDEKIYTEDICVFVPCEINSFFCDKRKTVGEHPIGVCFNSKLGKFQATCCIGKAKQKLLGHFSTPEEAYIVYKQFKEARSKELAKKWQSKIDNRVYEAMINWRI